MVWAGASLIKRQIMHSILFTWIKRAWAKLPRLRHLSAWVLSGVVWGSSCLTASGIEYFYTYRANGPVAVTQINSQGMEQFSSFQNSNILEFRVPFDGNRIFDVSDFTHRYSMSAIAGSASLSFEQDGLNSYYDIPTQVLSTRDEQWDADVNVEGGIPLGSTWAPGRYRAAFITCRKLCCQSRGMI